MCFNNLSSSNLIGLSSSLAILLSEELSTDEISLLGAFFTTLGDNLSLIATRQSIDDSKQSSNQESFENICQDSTQDF